MHRVTTGYLFKVFYCTYKLKWKPLFPAGFLDYTRSVKLRTVCFYMLCSLLNVLAYHLWVQFSKSTLFQMIFFLKCEANKQHIAWSLQPKIQCQESRVKKHQVKILWTRACDSMTLLLGGILFTHNLCLLFLLTQQFGFKTYYTKAQNSDSCFCRTTDSFL